MALYPNQKTVTIDKPENFSTFAIYGKPEICIACKVLNGSAFKVWCYLLSQKADTIWDISPKHAFNEWGISKSTFHDGINELIEKGFLDEKAIHLASTKDESEIRKPKRKSKKNESRTSQDTNYENNLSEFDDSNNIKENNITTNKAVLDENVSNIQNYDKEESSKMLDYYFKDTEYQDWRNNVDENGIWITPTNKRIKVRFDN